MGKSTQGKGVAKSRPSEVMFRLDDDGGASPFRTSNLVFGPSTTREAAKLRKERLDRAAELRAEKERADRLVRARERERVAVATRARACGRIRSAPGLSLPKVPTAHGSISGNPAAASA